MREHQDEFDRLGRSIVVVTFEAQQLARAYVAETGLPWPLLIDWERRLFRAYGMGRGGTWKILGPASWWAYLKILFRGRRLHAPTDDIYQLGGDVLVDPDGIVRLHYVSRTPVDRPDVATILSIVCCRERPQCRSQTGDLG